MYADVNFYLESFPHGQQEASCEIEASLALAEIKIDEATFNRIKGRGFENLTAFQQERIKLAACYQADYIHENGYDGSGVQSYSVLDISVTVKDSGKVYESLGMSPVAYALLQQTGLTGRIS